MDVHLIKARSAEGTHGRYLMHGRCGAEVPFKGDMPKNFTGWESEVTCWVCSGGSQATAPPAERPLPVPAGQQAAPKAVGQPATPSRAREAAAPAQPATEPRPRVNLTIAASLAFGLEKLARVTLPYACFGVVVVEDKIVEAAPIARWSIGKSVQHFEKWVLSKGGSLTFL